MLSIVKRDGRVVPFNVERINTAINKAMGAIGYKDSSLPFITASKIEQDIREFDEVQVEEIQDRIISILESEAPEVARAYKAYRKKRNKKRNERARKVYYEIIDTQATDVTRENANMNADTPAGQMMKFASETTKAFSNDDLLKEEHREAHIQGRIHIHDQDYYPTKSLTCVQHPLEKILGEGFRAGHGASRPAKRIETASILGCISMETCQNEMHGGQAIPAFDFYLAPYVKATFEEELKRISEVSGCLITDIAKFIDKHPIEDYLEKSLEGLEGAERYIQHAMNMTVKRVHQAMEAFIHNMNTIHSRGKHYCPSV